MRGPIYWLLLFVICCCVALPFGLAVALLDPTSGLIVGGAIFGWLFTEAMFKKTEKKSK